MRVEIIDGIECVYEEDYLAAGPNEQINHILVDVLEQKVITQKKMNAGEKEKRNAAARKVGEFYLVWIPGLYREFPFTS